MNRQFTEFNGIILKTAENGKLSTVLLQCEKWRKHEGDFYSHKVFILTNFCLLPEVEIWYFWQIKRFTISHPFHHGGKQMMLMDNTCPSVVTDVSVGNVVETLTSRIVDCFLFYAQIKAAERIMWCVFIDGLIHKFFSLGCSFDDGTSSSSHFYTVLHCKARTWLEFRGNLISHIKPSSQILVLW